MSDTQQSTATGAAVERVGAYRLALELSETAWIDGTRLAEEPLLVQIGPQLVRAVGSIAANIAEGYARLSRRDRIRFYEYALGSAEEARSWYVVARRALPAEDYEARLAKLTSIRRLLLTMIKNERAGEGWKAPSAPHSRPFPASTPEERRHVDLPDAEQEA